MWLVVEARAGASPCSAGFALREGELVVGRDEAACGLVLSDPSVSRRHATVTRRGDRLEFCDLGSSTGTRLNGRLVTGGELQPGDRLQLGNVLLRVERTVPPPEPSATPPPQAALPARPAAGANPLDWKPFRAFFEKLRQSTQPRELLERLLQGLVPLFRASRGLVLLTGKPGGEFRVVAQHRFEDGAAVADVSGTVCTKVVSTKAVLYVPDTSLDPLCSQAASLVTAVEPRSIVCGPLASGHDVFGVIYLDGPAGEPSLGASQLPLFETVTDWASELLAASQTRSQLLTARGRIEVYRELAQPVERLVHGPSAASSQLERHLQMAAPQEVSVLLTGETGTGKEMVARALHEASPRRDEPFVPVACAALPRDIIEAELFGSERGAYTGAEARRHGRFELAGAGTLFLDEVGEMPLDIQVKLLRVLQERSLTRLGGTQPIPLSFRLVCATNRNLEAAIREGTFREDLYYRMNVFRIHLTPLRERPDDIVPLAKHFLTLFAERLARRMEGFSPEAELVLRSYPWPGNVRELRNAVERALVVEAGATVQAESLPVYKPGTAAAAESADLMVHDLPTDYENARLHFERAFFKRCFARSAGNITAMGREAGLPRNTIYRRLRDTGLMTPKDQEPEASEE